MPSDARPEIIWACSVVRTVLSSPSSRKGQSDARGQAQDHGKQQVARNVRLNRPGGRAGTIHDAEIIGLQSCRDARFLQLLRAGLHRAGDWFRRRV